MRRALLLVLFAGVTALVAPTIVRAAEQSHAVAIASFSYAPGDIEIHSGDTVRWTNVDPVVHTVSADYGEFLSGSLHQGQTYSLRFNTPGVFSYFCEPHEQMRGRIIVLGDGGTASPLPSTDPRGRVATPATASTAPRRTSSSTSTSVVTPVGVGADAQPGGSAVAAATAAPVTGGIVTGTHRALATLPTAVAIILFAGVTLLLLLARDVTPLDSVRVVAGALTIATALLHLQLHFVLDYPEPIGSLMVIEAGAATLVGAYLLTTEWSRTMLAVGAGFHAVSIAAFALARTGAGLFGYHEVGWDPSPQAAGAVAVELAALALLLAAPRLRVAFSPSTPTTSSPSR